MPDVTRLASIEEPWIKATIMTPDEFLGSVLTLCTERRGEQLDLTYAGNRAMVVYLTLPLNEVVFDFYDRPKSSPAVMPVLTTSSTYRLVIWLKGQFWQW